MADTALAAADQPPSYPTAKCDSCKAPIIWAVTRQVRRIPIDAEPVGVAGGGNVLLSPGSPAPRATVVGGTQQSLLFGKRWVYRSHFATCSHADRHRHPRASNRGRS